MRILFVTSNRLGDAVLSTGLLAHLLARHPQARFTVACGPAAAGLFAHMPQLERLIVFPKRRFGLHWLGLWAKVVRRFWHLVVDIRGSGLAWLVPAWRRAVMRNSAGHKTAQLAALLRLSPPPMPVAWTGPDERALAAKLIPDGAPVLALAPTANWTGKVWPPAHFVALAAALPAMRVAVFAGPGAFEAGLAAPVLAALPGAIDLTGRLTLAEAVACLQRCALFVGNDSGLMHLAAAAGTPTLGLFGPGKPEEYAPAGRATAVAISPDGTMAGLGVDQALQAAARLLR